MNNKKVMVVLATALVSFVLWSAVVQAAGYKQIHKNAVVLAMFGTTVEPALKSLIAIQHKMQQRFPATPVRIAFTSNIIRKIWQKRAKNPGYITKHPEIPEEILHIHGPLATMANLQDEGYDTLVIQPTHIAPGEEYLDLTNYVKALDGIETIKKKYKPFNRVVIGRPALGTFGTVHPYAEDIETAARILAGDADLARQNHAALVYMGHGNDHFSSGGTYLEFAKRMRQHYPDVLTVIGCVEGFPSLEDVMIKLKKNGVEKLVLKPLMVVAGDHAMNDMAGEGEDSWKSVLQANGFTVIIVKKGLGEDDGFANIFVEHAADAAHDAGIELR